MSQIFKALLLCLLCGLGCSTLGHRSEKAPVWPVWIDTDNSVGQKDRDVDDGLALIQAFHSPELDIRGVSAVFGNTDLENAYWITQDMSKRFGPRELSVYAGATQRIQLGTETPASQALEAALGKYSGLTIIALGPLTNLATVIQRRPELASQIEQVVAVAGRRPGQRFTTGTTNPKAHRDFNFESDPEAFRVLLRSDVPIKLLPFEVSSRVWITEKDLRRFAKGGKAARWIRRPATRWLNLWKTTFSVDGFNPFDTLAIGYVIHPEWFHCEELGAQIKNLPDDVTEERMQGTHAKEKPYLVVSTRSERKVAYCSEVDPQFKEDLLARLLISR